MAIALAGPPSPHHPFSFSLRAELDLSFGLSAPAPASRKRDFVFVVNPKGANGQAIGEWKKLLPVLRTRLRDHCNIHESITAGPSHGVELTREAIRNGADAVIAVGGDGTLHEVVNGFFWDGKPIRDPDHQLHSTVAGLIPLGTGSDFARTFGWKNDPNEAIERILRGNSSKLDVGIITGQNGKQQVFINVADVHLSAKAGYYASKYKGFGNLCYVFGALRAFIGHQNQDFRIKVDEGDWEVFPKVTALCIGNGKYFGSGMKITPTANPCSGNLEVVILQDFKWYDFLLKLHKLYNGTHLSEKGVYLRSVKSIQVVEETPNGSIFVQSDGEHLGFLPAKCCIEPATIEFFC